MHHFAQVQIRIDPDIAETLRRDAKAHFRVFKRKKSFAATVNEILREGLAKLHFTNPDWNTPK